MKRNLITIFLLLILTLPTFAQKKKEEPKGPEKLVFTTQVDLKATPVKNQASTGTCWCFASVSFLESELLRTGKGEYDLSEMFIVRNNYMDRIKDNYLRRGKGNLGPGSVAHDVLRIVANDGIVPDEVYRGLNYGSPTHNHGELQQFINAVAGVAVSARKESEQYYEIVNSVLDTYLGEYPSEFTYKGTRYTPKSFAENLGLDMSNYIEITSYTHIPYYQQSVLVIPDNWSMGQMYNVPIDELVEILDNALNTGYTVAWDADVSETGFSHANGIAQLNVTAPRTAQTDRDRLEGPAPVSGPVVTEEDNPTQEYRQATFENFTTTDDHLMHITGRSVDQFGNKYYKTKNSWGTDRSEYGGYLFTSEKYFRGKTIAIVVHKDAIPAALKTKLGIK